MRNLLYIGMILLLAFVSCEEKVTDAPVAEEVSLELILSVPEISISTKGLDDPWDEDLSDWTNWDKFTDGRDLYEVAVFLIEVSTGTLVGFRDMYASSVYTDENNGFWNGTSVEDESVILGTAAKVSFLYDDPQGGRTIEKLRRGVYQVLAVSNFSPVSADVTGTAAYGGLIGALGNSQEIDTPFFELIDNVAAAFDPEDGIPDFKNSQEYSDIWEFNIVTDDNHLCHRQPQPLTAVKYIELTPGMNTFSLGLERTYVRVRIEVENNSGKETLTVNDFDFCDWFTQRAAYLFNDPTDNSRNYDISSTGLNTYKKSPVLEIECDGRTSTEPGDKPGSYSYQGSAIVSFKEPVEIGPGESKVIFDGYVFGSKLGAAPGDGETYQYSLDVEYKNVTNYLNGYVIKGTSPITSLSDFTDYYENEGHQFVIQSQHAARGNRFLMTDGQSYAQLAAVSLDDVKAVIDGEQAYEYVFELEPSGNTDGYYFKTLGATPYWFGSLTYGNMPGLNNISGSEYIIGENTSSMQGLTFFNNGYYINSMNDTGGAWNGVDIGSQFQLYPLESKGMGSPRLSSDIDLLLIDPVTAAVYPVTNIKRNDFINVLVSVAYNEADSRFDISSVIGWDVKDEGIEFH